MSFCWKYCCYKHYCVHSFFFTFTYYGGEVSVGQVLSQTELKTLCCLRMVRKGLRHTCIYATKKFFRLNITVALYSMWPLNDSVICNINLSLLIKKIL